MATQHNRPYVYLQGKIQKDETARQIAQRDGITEGLVCIFSIVEPGRSFSFRFEKGRPFVQSAKRKCLHLYFYFIDRDFGLIHIRLQTWFPMVSFRQGCVEGRRPVGTDLGWSVLSWFDSNEQLVPLVVLARGGRPPAWKSLIQQLDVGDQVLLHPSPVWQSLATGAADLVGKKLDGTVVDPVIMWFNNALAVFVAKPNQTFLLDCSPK